MTEVTAGAVAAASTSGIYAMLADAGPAPEDNDAEVKTANSNPLVSDNIVENSSDCDSNDYIVTYCMCLH